jgi:L-alanine-DL-glutamate epimerase-like enolase superfamily enzyme
MAAEAEMIRFFHLVKLKRMRFLKLKVGNEADLRILQKAREILGWEIDIRVDANSAWTAAEAVQRIREMAPYRISAVEQPVAKSDFEGLKTVSQAVPIPIIADESLCTEEDARRLIALQACRIFNIRLSKCGGLRPALRILAIAEVAGVGCQLGCHVGETSILSGAGRHFALCADRLAYVEGSLSNYLLTKDPVAQSVGFADGGVAYGLNGPGLGIEVLEQVLEELALSHWSS